MKDPIQREEKSCDVIDACVPRGTTEKLAYLTCRVPESVNVWRRPRRENKPNKFNPLELCELILEHALIHAPHEAHRIHQYLERRYRKFWGSILGDKKMPLTPDERDREVADLAKESSDVIEAVLCKATPENVRREAEELKRKIDEIVARIESPNVVVLPRKAASE